MYLLTWASCVTLYYYHHHPHHHQSDGLLQAMWECPDFLAFACRCLQQRRQQPACDRSSAARNQPTDPEKRWSHHRTHKTQKPFPQLTVKVTRSAADRWAPTSAALLSYTHTQTHTRTHRERDTRTHTGHERSRANGSFWVTGLFSAPDFLSQNKCGPKWRVKTPQRTHGAAGTTSTCGPLVVFCLLARSIQHLRIPLHLRTIKHREYDSWPRPLRERYSARSTRVSRWGHAQPQYASSFGHGGALLPSGAPRRPQDSSLQEFYDRGDPDRSPRAQSVGSGRGAPEVRGPGSAVRPAFPQPAG